MWRQSGCLDPGGGIGGGCRGVHDGDGGGEVQRWVNVNVNVQVVLAELLLRGRRQAADVRGAAGLGWLAGWAAAGLWCEQS